MAQSETAPDSPVASRRSFLKASTTALGAALAGGLYAEQSTQAEDTVGSQERPTVRPSSAAGALPAASRGCPPEVREALSGPWPSIRTLFTHQGDIDFDALRKHLDFLIEEAKAKTVVLTWGDSLYSILTDDEIAQVAKVVAQHVKKRAFVVAATDQWWTGKSVAFAKYCVSIGADMLMVLPPDWAASTTVKSLVAHYAAVAKEIPVMLVTNYLAQRGQSFGLEVIKAVHEQVPGVIAVKDDVCGEFARRLCLLTRDRWAVSAGGAKENHMNMFPYGVDGYLSTFITFKPEIAWRYWNAVQARDLEAARAVLRDYDQPFFDYISAAGDGGFDAAIHGVFELFGIAKRYRRLPYHSFSDKQMEDLATFLHQKRIL